MKDVDESTQTGDLSNISVEIEDPSSAPPLSLDSLFLSILDSPQITLLDLTSPPPVSQPITDETLSIPSSRSQSYEPVYNIVNAITDANFLSGYKFENIFGLSNNFIDFESFIYTTQGFPLDTFDTTRETYSSARNGETLTFFPPSDPPPLSPWRFHQYRHHISHTHQPYQQHWKRPIKRYSTWYLSALYPLTNNANRNL